MASENQERPAGGSTKKQPAKKKAARAPRRKKRVAADAMTHVFVTGYPGFIGKRLAARILTERPRTRLTLLVQEKFVQDAQRDIAALGEKRAKRARVIAGDVAKMDLGLSGPEISQLIESVSHVFHLAAVQYLGTSDIDYERVNVGGTRNVLALAEEMRSLKRFVHFSTCYVSGDRIGVITEDELELGQKFRNPYEETKYRAERLVRGAAGRLPTTILRPAIVVGDSQTGQIDRFDGVYAMGILIVTSPISVPLPLPGDGVAPLNVVPVDFVTRAAVHLARDKSAVGKTFHLVDPNPLSSRHVYELIAKRAGKKIPRVRLSYGIAKRVLRMPLIERFSRRQAQALDYLNHLAIYNCANTLEHLEGTGILCPRIDTYVDKLMHYVQDALRQKNSGRRTLSARADPYDS